MFGYISINKAELKFKEFDIYHSFYCGLCRCLKEKYGKSGQMTLSYDMTFLVMLLAGLYEPEEETGKGKCIAHPFEKHIWRKNEFTEYVADMNLLLSYYKCKDDWADEKKYTKLIYSKILNPKYKKMKDAYSEKVDKIVGLLKDITVSEKAGEEDIDMMSGRFGEIMGEIFVYRQDEWSGSMYKIGFYLGKFIYLMDAYEDIEADLKNKTYNPLLKLYQEDGFEEYCQQILTMMMAECSKEFEKLPILDNIEILRNILYSGVWCRFDMVTNKRKNKQEKTDG